MALLGKDFIGLKDLSADDILYILETAETMKHVLSQKNKKSPYLQGKSIVLLFYEKSARTKLSYELAAQYLSASFVDMSVSTDLSHQSSLLDAGRIVDQMGSDYIIVRHPASGSAQLLAENVSASVINAGDGLNEAPSQALIDLLTIKNQKGGFKGLKVAIIGDVVFDRVAKSNIFGLVKLGAEVSVAAPPTLIPYQLESLGVTTYNDAAEAARGADVIMVLRMLPERQNEHFVPSLNEYKTFFKVNERMVRHAAKNVIIMHPGPINRGIEISSEVIDSSACLTNDQIGNGVSVKMALLYLLSLKGVRLP